LENARLFGVAPSIYRLLDVLAGSWTRTLAARFLFIVGEESSFKAMARDCVGRLGGRNRPSP
jgi:hypothetical protein